ncbi:MAG: BMP family ABC transporter substrate-binding protein [Phycisphaerae bacterium]|nr:BMP family ABC transporter substrate-binding protein [Phycisphaerae bacterium]
MRRICLVLLTLLATLVALAALPACRKHEPVGRSNAVRQVALIAPEPGDHDFSSLCRTAFEHLSSQGVRTNVYLSQPDAAREAAVQAGKDGADVIIFAGPDFLEAAGHATEIMPNVRIVCVGAAGLAPHVESVVLRADQAAYLSGLAAGACTQTRRVAAVGNERGQLQEPLVAAFVRGARDWGSNVMPETLFAAQTQPDAVGQAARTVIHDGADMIFNASRRPAAVFTAAADSPNVFAFESWSDLSSLAPKILIASGVVDFDAVFAGILQRTRAASRLDTVEHSLADGVVRWQVNPALADRLGEDARKRIAEAEREIKAGRLDVHATATSQAEQ